MLSRPRFAVVSLPRPVARGNRCDRLADRAATPRVEALEGRALLTAGALDSSFGNGGYVTNSGLAAPVSVAAVQPWDGKTLLVGSDGSAAGVSRLQHRRDRGHEFWHPRAGHHQQRRGPVRSRHQPGHAPDLHRRRNPGQGLLRLLPQPAQRQRQRRHHLRHQGLGHRRRREEQLGHAGSRGPRQPGANHRGW